MDLPSIILTPSRIYVALEDEVPGESNAVRKRQVKQVAQRRIESGSVHNLRLVLVQSRLCLREAQTKQAEYQSYLYFSPHSQFCLGHDGVEESESL